MNLIAFAAQRARAARKAGDDAGFMLIYVLTIVAVIATLVGGTLVVTGNAIVPAVKSAYAQAADAAAQGGLQAFIAYIDDPDNGCAGASTSVSDCTLPKNFSGTVEIPVPGASDDYTATYSWVATKDPANRYFRVRSVGVVKQGGLSAAKVVVGDVVGGSTMNVLDYGVVTGFESQSSSTVLADWPARTIALNCTAVDAADVPLNGDRCGSDSTYLNSMNWSGSSPGTAAGKVAVCNAAFDTKGGRGNNPPPKAPNAYADWTETGLNGNNYTNFQPCQTGWGTRTRLVRAIGNGANGDGGYYSNDALLLSNGYPGGSGPLFDQPVSTGWKYTTDDAGICGLAPGQNYRAFNLQCPGYAAYPVEVGGAPASTSLFPQVSTGEGPQVPTLAPRIPADACIYAGPTRVRLNGNTAVVTSPQTTPAWIAANASTRPSGCYTGATPNGMALKTIDLTGISVIAADNNGTVPKTTPAIAHGSSGWPTTGQKRGDPASTTNTVFFLTSGASGTTTDTAYALTAPAAGYTAAAGTNPPAGDGAYTPQWTKFTSGSTCSTSTDLTDLRFFNCYYNGNNNVGATYSATAYNALQAAVQAAIAGNPAAYTSDANAATNLQTLVQNLVKGGNSTDAANSAPMHQDNTSHRWVAGTATPGSGGGCTQTGAVAGSATDTPISAPSSDEFFANTDGNVHAVPSTGTTCYTVPVTLQVGTCGGLGAGGTCVGGTVWGPGDALITLGATGSVPQFKVTFTVKKTTTTTTTTAAASTFPSMLDVTQYQMGKDGTFGANGPGDLYVEGTAGHTMAAVASNDVIVTGDLSGTVDDTTNRSTSAIEVIGQNNVYVYHPVKCLSTDVTAIAKTDPGFCPNDITGLYDSVPPDGTRPDQQYVNLRPDLAGLTIRGVVMALGNADAHITCPEPAGGGGVCGGEFTVFNYDRGAALDYLNQIGTLAMAHHAPVGKEWQIPDTTGQTSRPYSGYQMSQQYENLKNLVSGLGDLLDTTSSTTANWHVLSVSTGTVTSSAGGGS